MAKKFNNGQTFGEIRKILNDNADEINANATAAQQAKSAADNAQAAADNAQTTASEAKTAANKAQTTSQTAHSIASLAKTVAEQMAGQGVDGRAAGITETTLKNTELNSLSELFSKGGSMTYKNGVGVPYARKLKTYNFNTADDADNLPYGVPFILDGAMGMVGPTSSSFDYFYGYAKRQVFGLMMLVKGWCVVIDINHGDIWMKQIGTSSESNNGWKSLSIDIPFASINSIGGFKLSHLTGSWGNNAGFDLAKLIAEGNISATSEGRPYVHIQLLKSFNFGDTGAGNETTLNMGPVFLYGSGTTYDSGTYQFAWKTDSIRALAFFIYGYVWAIDFDTQDVWCTQVGEKQWHKATSGSDYTLSVASATTLGGIKTGAGLTTAADGTTRIADSANLPGVPTASSADTITTPYYAPKLVTEGRLITGEPVGLIDSCNVAESNPVFVDLFMRPGSFVARHARVWFRAKYTGGTVIINMRNILNGQQNSFNIEISSGLTAGSMYMMDLTIVSNDNLKLDVYYTLTPAKFLSNITDSF